MSRFLRTTLLALSIVFCASASAQAGTIVADSGFRPDVNGFSFRNYGKGHKGLDKAEMQRIYGQAACIYGKGKRCVLHPIARQLMEQSNSSMEGGHCYGFATLTQLIHANQLPRFGYRALSAFGSGAVPFDLDLDSSDRLQRSIARSFYFQNLPSVSEGTIQKTPKDVVDHLIAHLGAESPETWNLVIFKWGMEGGHGITPYAVEDMGEGRFEIHVYDNNWPGDANRRVYVDTVKNTWKYFASTNPEQTQYWYEGNGKSQTLRLMPNQPALGVQPCPYCVGRRGEKAKYNQVVLSGGADEHARLLITDPNGRQTGYRNGRLINKIPGAKVLPQTSGGIEFAADGTVESLADSPEPIYLIPKNLKLRIRIDGRDMKVDDTESIGVVGPTFDATIENVKVGPGKVAFATLSPKKQTLSVTGSKGQSSPMVTFGADSEKAAYRVNVSAIKAPSKSTFFFAKKPRYQLLRIGSKFKANQAFRVKIDKYDASNSINTYARSYRLKGNQVAFLYYGPLGAGKRAYVVISSANGERVKLLKLRKVTS